MEWDNWEETEQEYENRKRAESKASTGLLSSLVQLAILLGTVLIIFGPFFYAAFLGAQKLLDTKSAEAKVWVAAALLFYFAYSLIYFFKGIIIALHTKSKWWLVPWTICVFICCIIPAFVVKSIVGNMFLMTERTGTLYLVLSWGAFILFSIFAYKLFKFRTPVAPSIFHWSYTLGLKLLGR